MRRTVLAVAALFLTAPAFAQVHQATPLADLMTRLRVHHHHDGPYFGDHSAAAAAPVRTAPAAPDAAKTFNIVARQFEFIVTPAPFVVNAGDIVTLNISVPSGDGSQSGHGFILERYIEDAPIVARGRTFSITFTATTPGTFTYLCSNSGCGTGHSRMNGIFTVNAAPAPTLTAINPSSGPISGGTAVTITGTNFLAGAKVDFDGHHPATNVTVVSDTTITVTTPEGHEGGSVSVAVVNPDGQRATLANAFTYLAAAPTITSFSPKSGPVAGGTVVTINGTNFESGMSVKFGSAQATSLTFVGASQLLVVAPAASAPGPVSITVTRQSGQSVAANESFVYTGTVAPRRRATK